mgnify:CR=1 FL=1
MATKKEEAKPAEAPAGGGKGKLILIIVLVKPGLLPAGEVQKRALPVTGYAGSKTVPGAETWPGTGRRSGSKPPLLVSRAQRRLWRDRKNAGNLRIWRVPARHREAERDTTGSIRHQHPVHTWIGRAVQGSVATRKRPCQFAVDPLGPH